jgi:hypothetical protein
MSEWWTYTLSDFLLFTPATYRRLFELYNRDIWPGQAVGLAIGIAILLALLRGGKPARGREVAALLAACWAWIAGAFLYERYATINWAAVYFAAAFGLEALLFVVTGVLRARLAFAPARNRAARIGMLLFLFALAGQPVLGIALGRHWYQAEVFGVAPDPTAVATLGILLCGIEGRHWHLALVPLLWCATSGAFLLAMESPEALVMAAAGIGALVLNLGKPVTAPAGAPR